MTDREKKVSALHEITEILASHNFDITVRVGLLEILKHSHIQAATIGEK